jgi:hypothetical protein
MRRFAWLCGLLVLVSLVLVAPISAQATVTEVVQTCNSFTATGTTDQPYIVVEVWSWINEAANTYVDYIYVSVPVNPDGSFTFSSGFDAQPPNTVIYYWLWGSPTNNVSGWDGKAWYDSGAVPCVPAAEGPSIPAGFVLRTITCDVPVYNTAAGSPVAGGAAIKAGQTWYVNPTPVDGDDGRQWTELFAGGYSNGFIPTACVN